MIPKICLEKETPQKWTFQEEIWSQFKSEFLTPKTHKVRSTWLGFHFFSRLDIFRSPNAERWAAILCLLGVGRSPWKPHQIPSSDWWIWGQILCSRVWVCYRAAVLPHGLLFWSKQQNTRCPEQAAHGLEHVNTFVCHIHHSIGTFRYYCAPGSTSGHACCFAVLGKTAKQQTKQQNSKSSDWR